MNKLGLMAVCALLLPAVGVAEISVGPAFRQALDQAGFSDRSQIGVAPKAGQGASVLKTAAIDFTPTNTSYIPEQYFKSRTVITAHVWNGDEGEFLPDTVYDREGFQTRFTDGSIKYQFVFMKVYKNEAFTIVNMVETTHGASDEQGAFEDQIESQAFLIPAGKKDIVKETSTATMKGVDQGDGVLRYDAENGSSTLSTRVVNADRSEDNTVNTTGMSTVINENFTLTGVDTTYRLDPIKQSEMLKNFQPKVQEFLQEFARLHWTAVFAGQILGDCLAKAGGDAEQCAEQQASYDEAHAARHEYWAKTIEVKDIASLKPTQTTPKKK